MYCFSLKDKTSVKELDVPSEAWVPLLGYVLQDDGPMLLFSGVVEDPYREVSFSLAVCLATSATRTRESGRVEARLSDVLAAMHASLRVWWAGRQSAAAYDGVPLDDAHLSVHFQKVTLNDVFCSAEKTVEDVEAFCLGNQKATRATSFLRLPDAASGREVALCRLMVVRHTYGGGEHKAALELPPSLLAVVLPECGFLRSNARGRYTSVVALRAALTEYLGGLYEDGTAKDRFKHGEHELEATVLLYGGRVAAFRFDGAWLRQVKFSVF